MAKSLAFYKKIKWYSEMKPSEFKEHERKGSKGNELSPIKMEFIRTRTLKDVGNILEYEVSYDKKVKDDGFILQNGEPVVFDEYFSKNLFHAHYFQKSDTVAFTTSYRNSDSMLREMDSLLAVDDDPNTAEVPISGVLLQKYDIDLKKLTEKLNTNQAWFRIIHDNAYAASVAGDNVTSSDIYKDLEKKGTHSSLTFEIKHSGITYNCVISSKGSLYIQNNIDEDDALVVLEKIKGILEL